MASRAGALSRRDVALSVAALIAGAVVAWIDTRPHFDDTGVIVTLLLVLAILVAAVSGRRPWLWAILIGAPLPLVELAQGGSTASFAALAFTAVGASLGYLIAVGMRSRTS